MAFLDQLRTVLDKKIKINAEFIFLLQGLLFMKSLQKLRKSPAWGVRISRFDFRVLGARERAEALGTRIRPPHKGSEYEVEP